MSFQAMSWAVRQKTGSAASKMVLLMLANHANGHTGQCNPSHKLLADECEMSVSSLKVHIKNLEEKGFLSILHKTLEGVCLPNQYVLHINSDSDTPSDLIVVGQNLADGGSESGWGVGQNLATKQEIKPVIEPNKEKVKKEKSNATATRLPADWQPSQEDISFCKTNRPDLNYREVAQEFKDYWIALPDAKARKTDWAATWRNWVRKQRQNFSKKPSAHVFDDDYYNQGGVNNDGSF